MAGAATTDRTLGAERLAQPPGGHGQSWDLLAPDAIIIIDQLRNLIASSDGPSVPGSQMRGHWSYVC
jgi:hypothetical protein